MSEALPNGSKIPLANCGECPLKHQPFVHPKVRRAPIALVGERPDKHELEKGHYFAGPTGELLTHRILPSTGLSLRDLSLHNAVPCAIPQGRKLSPAEWRQALLCCAPRLHRDLKRAQPKVVVAAGKRALQTLCGRAQITQWIGAPLQGKGEFSKYVVLPIMHPAWHFRGGNMDYLPMSRIHFQRAKDLLEKKIGEWTWPRMEIEPTIKASRLLARLHAQGRQGKPIAVDVETIGTDPFKDKMSCIGVGHHSMGAVSMTWDDYNAGKWGHQEGISDKACEQRAWIEMILEDPRITKVAHNAQYDLMCLRARGIEINGPIYDTMVAHAVYAPALKHNLALVCAMEFSAPRWKDEFHAGAGEVKGKEAFERSDPQELRIYNCKDNIMTSHLQTRCDERIAETHRGQEIFAEYTELCAIANDMCFRGVKVDQARRKYHHHALRTRMGRMAHDLRRLATAAGFGRRGRGRKRLEFNPNSGAHMRRLFFEVFNVKPIKFSETTGAPSLDESVLVSLVTHPNNLVQATAKATLQYRRWGVLDRNHVRGLRLDNNSVVHPFWKPTGTIGWRWTSSKPNAQNIPKAIEERTPSGKRKVIHGGLRDMFRGHIEKSWVVEADYKQIEARIAAFLSNDTPTLEVYDAFDNHGGPDPHTVNANDLFGLAKLGRPPTSRERTLAKNFLYGGILYGGEPETIHAVLSVDAPIQLSLVEALIQRYMAKHPNLERWHNELVVNARKFGYVEEPVSGRRRHFWGRIKPTEVYNYPVQTLAGWIINQAIKKVHKELRWGKEGILFQVHDALLVDGPDPLRLAEILKGCMDYTLEWEGRKMRFPVDIQVGRAWTPHWEMSMDEIRLLKKGKTIEQVLEHRERKAA